MEFPTLATIAVVMLAFAVAGLVKGVVAMGMPTVSMVVMTFALPVPRALALMIVPTVATNLWQAIDGPHLTPVLRRLWPLHLCALLGTLAGLGASLNLDPRASQAALGGILTLYAALSLLAVRPSVPARLERPLTPAMGLASGVMSGLTGIFVLPAIPYIQALDMHRDALIQALGLTFLVATLSLGIGLAGFGAIGWADLALSGMALVPAFLGMEAGKRLRGTLEPETFRLCFLGMLLLSGLHLVYRAVA